MFVRALPPVGVPGEGPVGHFASKVGGSMVGSGPGSASNVLQKKERAVASEHLFNGLSSKKCTPPMRETRFW